MLRRSFLALVAGVPLIRAARAQTGDYPNRPVRLVVGYPQGGGNDLIARVVAAKLQDKLGQTVIVDNKPGAQSMVAAEIVAKAPPDGYTLLIAPSGPMTVNPAVYGKLPYDPVRDFMPVSLIAEFPLLLAVGAQQPPKSVRELIEYGRADPTRATYAASAAPFRLAAELFNQRTGSSFRYVSYSGGGDAVQAVVAGEALMSLSDSASMAAALKSGKLRALGITTTRRPPAFPDIPTLAESGVPDMDIALWTGIVAPAGTPSGIVERLQDLVEETLEAPTVRAGLEAIFVDPRSTSTTEFRELIARDIEHWKAVATKANIKLD